MGYIFGIVGVVLGGSVICSFLYYIFNSKTNLDDAYANAKEERRFGRSSIEEYEEDEIEVFQDFISVTDELVDIDFNNSESQGNKFMARRVNNEKNVEVNVEEVREEPTVTPQVVPQPQQPVLQPITTEELYNQINNDDFDNGIEEL